MLLPSLQSTLKEAGIDEAGRGCYAGPVFAAAVILPPDFRHPDINDSKKLSPAKREMLRPIIERESIAWAVASIDNEEIDRINILQATYKAMHLAVDRLATTPGLLLVDGNRFKKYPNIPHQCIIHGDGLYASIAAAGILAKTHRDEFMNQLHKKYPEYAWIQNKGYGTAAHREAIRIHGFSPYHRKSFNI
ncbi:MAG: ribonuclease HII [Chitinophagaceae bacterium]|nr:ribonuclease HII [Chitinophagaceae bacterium]